MNPDEKAPARTLPETLLSPYDPSKTENRLYQLWEKGGYFRPEKSPGRRREKFTVMIAPPNITGSLHMGHALENTLSDIMVRYQRMRGAKTLWLPGLDHAGIATQNAVEKELKKQGLSRQKLGREKFLAKVREWKDKYGQTILNQLKQLGCSLDWSRARFTLDEKYQEAVRYAFVSYYERGLIYRGERVINWCAKDQTALSDLELEYLEKDAALYYLKYPLADGAGEVVVATTRPETMLGDAAVAVHPDDDRYRDLVGKNALLPLVNRQLPIIADAAVDPCFGSGAVKVTPAHDQTDSEIGRRHRLPNIKIIDERGKISDSGTEWDGLGVLAARERIVARLKEQGFWVKEEPIRHRLAVCYRCGSAVEPLLSSQWFLAIKPLATKAAAAIEKGEVSYRPNRWRRIALAWLEGARDWCISRQIWWGHRLPVWFHEPKCVPRQGYEKEIEKCEEMVVSLTEPKCKNCDAKYTQAEDVLDTWFSAALWPFAALGWPEKTSDLKEFYPTNFITSAPEIIHLWIARMIFSGLEFTNQVPFQEALIHATVLTKEGKRMSKSLGTGVDPLALIGRYGADAVRFGLVYQEFGGQDIKFSEDNIKMGRKFANKLWNIARYILTKTSGKIYDHAPASPFRQKLEASARQATTNLENYQFGEAAHALYDFVWHELADIYLEGSKSRDDEATKITLGYTLDRVLRLLHPFMPFVTEEIWTLIGGREENGMLIIQPWPAEKTS